MPATAFTRYLDAQHRKDLLRLITCGSVDDGKSTLIGRLLYESKLLHDDQLAQLELDSRRAGARGGDLDLSLLVDGLAAEREQGITIDVAYRYFSTARRNFIVADTPGHEQYTRNMATGASTADVAVILVDARKGVLTQTRRHSYLAALLGIRHVLVAVNKMDLVGFERRVFDAIRDEYAAFAARIGLEHVAYVPVSALTGDNVVARSSRMPWHPGPTFVEYLETVEVDAARAAGPFRFPVQSVVRPDQDFRGLAGTIVGGTVRAGDRVRVLPSGRESTVARIATYDGDLPSAEAGRSVTLVLADPIDVGRGDVVVAADAPAAVADQWQATIVWMNEHALLPGRPYLLKLGTRTVGATITELKHRVAIDTLEPLAAKQLELNEIGVCNVSLAEPVPFDPYAENRDTGGFILIDRQTCETVGAGLIHFALRRADNIHWQALDVDRDARAGLKHQRPAVVWFTGLSASGKSTIANLVEKRLHAHGRHTYLLDGDNVRHGLNRDLGFTDADRVENVRRVAEVAKLMADAGLIVLVAFISPFRAERRMARELLPAGEFVEVHVDVPLAEAERRDPKGLYAKARRGELRNFTGVDAPYEVPEAPEMRIDTTTTSPEQAAERVVDWLERRIRGD